MTTFTLTLTGGVVIGVADVPAVTDVHATAPSSRLTATLVSTFNSIVGTASSPSLIALISSGVIITVRAAARAPVLVATLQNPAIITFAGTAFAPRMSAQILSGNAMTFIGQAASPIMAAAGYPAYILTLAGVAPHPRLSATLVAALAVDFRTWVLNTRKAVLTEYGPEFAFNSYAFFNGKVLACGAGGIVELGTQGLDNTTPITARARTGPDGFGSSVLKRLPRAYLGHRATGDLIFRTITAEGGTRSYLLAWNHSADLQQRRVPIGKGPKSRWFQIEIENIAGADFGINDVLLYPTALRRRVQ